MGNARWVTCSTCGGDARSSHFTRREVEILLLIADEAGDGDIALSLGISIATVQAHIKNMRRKANVRSRSGLIVRSFAARILLADRIPPCWSGSYCL